MIWRIESTNRARRDLNRLDIRVSRRVLEALSRLAETGYGDLKLLRGSEREYRLRVGQWRVILLLDRKESILRVLRVLHRSEAYRQ